MKHHAKKITALLIVAALLAQLFAFSALAARSAFAGDITMNGEIGPDDARLALRMSIGLENYTTAHKRLADVDADGEIAPADARLILRISVGLESSKRMIVVTDEEMNTYVFTGADSTIGISGGTSSPDNTTSPDSSAKPLPQTSVPMPAADPTPGTFTFTVYGWGDGVGMSQYGAVGMAQNGYTCEQILKHYYTGVKLVTDTSYPEYTDYVYETPKTDELVARIVYMEMYGIVDDDPAAAAEALKAQAVVVFTLLKYYGFDVSRDYLVGVASDLPYSALPEDLRTIVRQVRGQYLAESSDSANAPIEALYFAIAAGKTASAKDVWGHDCSYLQSVSSPYDVSAPRFSRTFTFTKEDMRQMIRAYDSDIALSADASQWIRILSHSASIDSARGYVTKVQVGDRTLDGYSEFCDGLMEDYFWSSGYFGVSTCFYITYTP